MFNFGSNLSLLLMVLCGCYGAVDIKKYFKLCDRNALDVNDCLMDAMRKGIAVMADGIPDLNIPGIDPFLQKDFKLDYNNNQEVPAEFLSWTAYKLVAKMVMKNIYVTGLKSAVIKDVRLKADEDKFHMEADLTSPLVRITGEYKGQGRFNALKILAEGSVNTTMTDLTYTWKLDGVPEKNGTETYIRIKDFYMRPDVGNMIVSIVNTNPESKELTDLGVTFANNNWRTLYKEFLPFAQANWNKNGVRIANRIFLKVPYNKLFPST